MIVDVIDTWIVLRCQRCDVEYSVYDVAMDPTSGSLDVLTQLMVHFAETLRDGGHEKCVKEHREVMDRQVRVSELVVATVSISHEIGGLEYAGTENGHYYDLAFEGSLVDTYAFLDESGTSHTSVVDGAWWSS